MLNVQYSMNNELENGERLLNSLLRSGQATGQLPSRIVAVQECDATMLNRITNAG